MIISKTKYNSGRTVRICERCRSKIQKWAGRWRLFGRAHVGDSPYVIWWCEPCHDEQIELQKRRASKPLESRR